MNILLVGDTHGDLSFLRHQVIPAAVKHGISLIVQLGDFGAWEAQKWGRKFVHELSLMLVENEIGLLWIDGNHDDHDSLNQIYLDGGVNRGDFTKPIPIRTNVSWLPRGSRFEYGASFLACGGAYSIDKGYRIPGESWWAGETIQPRDVGRCTGGGRVDVLLAHDCPFGIDIPSTHKSSYTGDYPETDINRRKLTAIVNKVKPKLVFHGHWHVHHDTTAMFGDQAHHPVRVIGLANNNAPPEKGPSMAILDTQTFAVSYPEDIRTH